MQNMFNKKIILNSLIPRILISYSIDVFIHMCGLITVTGKHIFFSLQKCLDSTHTEIVNYYSLNFKLLN